MNGRVGPEGEIVIPAQPRHELGLQPGDEVEFRLDGDWLSIRPVGVRKPLLGRFAGESFTDELERERAKYRDREEPRLDEAGDPGRASSADREVWLEEAADGRLVARAQPGVPPLTDDDVRRLIEQDRGGCRVCRHLGM
jgi:AbrB family looped-hinge helix DNA binding protein